jgi:hypothetical protein
MRGIERGARSFRATAAGILIAALAASSCKTITDVVEARPEPRAPEVLEGNEIALVVTRFTGEPRQFYTALDRFHFRVSFDPTVVDLTHLESFGLWSQDRPGGPWKRLGTFPAKRESVSTTFRPPAEGAYGLRASAVYDDGTELFVPSEADGPILWLYVDRTPPRITWISPSIHRPVTAGEKIQFEWGASEMRFGEVPSIFEWSPDGGATWRTIDRVKAERGTGGLVWKVPQEAARTGSRPIVRLTAWDLVGNRASALLPLTAQGGSPPGRPDPVAAAVRSPAAAEPRPTERAEPPAAPEKVGAAREGGVALAPAVSRDREKAAAGEPTPRQEARKVETPRPPEPRKESAAPVRPAIALKNLREKEVLRAASGRQIVFSAEAAAPEVARVVLQWRAGPDRPWTEGGSAAVADGKILWKTPPESFDGGAVRLLLVDPAGGAEPLALCETPVSVDGDAPSAGIRGIALGPSGEPLVSLDVYDRGPAGLGDVQLFVTSDGGASWEAIDVDDPSAPVSAAGKGENLGFWVAASDRAGNATARPQAGSVPQKVFEPAMKATLEIEEFENEFLRGGDQGEIAWRYEGPAGLQALAEVSTDGGSSWEPVGEVPARSGKTLWIVPGESGAAICRVRVKLDDGSVIEGRAKPVRIDAGTPQLEAGQIPARHASELKFPLAVTDPGGSGLEGVTAYLRPAAGKTGVEGKKEPAPWTPRPGAKAVHDAASGAFTIAVADLPEGPYEFYLSARDRAGNGGGVPGTVTLPTGRFFVDRTPVAIRATPTAGPWVEGLGAAVQVEMDLADAVPPLWLEEKSGDAWTEVLRWESLTPGDDLFRFPVPVGRDRMEVRFGIRDAAGNASYAVVPARDVERSIRIAPLPDGAPLKAGANFHISWSVHPALDEVASELKVVVAHQPRDGGEWVQLFDDLRPSSTPVWPVTTADEESHRLRVSLLHRGKVIGADSSAPFRIAGGPPAPAKIDPRIVKISKESLYYSDRADAQIEIWKSSRAQQAKWLAGHTSGMKKDAQGNVLPQEMERLAPDIRRQRVVREQDLVDAAETIRKNYTKALEEDPKNYRAAYGMAQLLHRIAPDRPDEAIGYLQKAVAIKPDHSAALNDLGASLIIEGDYESAEEPLRRALSIEDTASYRYNLALALFHQKKTVEARQHFGEVLAKGGPAIRTGEVYYYIVSAFIQEGKTDEAKEHLHLYRDQIPAALRESLEASLRG